MGEKENVIVKGLTLITREKKEEFEKWVWEEMGVKIRVEIMERIEAGWKVRLEELEKKVELMKNKAKLGQMNWGVWIADDHTERQKEVQGWLEREAGAWRRRGVTAKTEYMKIYIDGST